MARSNDMNGQSLVELLISLAFGVLVMLTAFGMMRFLARFSSYDPVAQTATFIGRQVAYSASAAADGSWANVASTAPGVQYRVATSSAGFAVVAGPATTTVNGIAYSSYFTVDPVARDAVTDVPVASGGIDDPATKKVTTTVSWTYQGKPYSDTIEGYVTRTKNEAIWQTDWSGGPTAPGSDPVIAPGMSPTQFYADVSSTLDYSSVPGSMRISGL